MTKEKYMTTTELEESIFGTKAYEVSASFQDNPQSPLDMVREFAKVMGQGPCTSRSAKLIYEEHSEWELARITGSSEEELKELADLVYVIYGYSTTRGWDLDEAVRRVHKNNLERCIQPDGSVQYREDGKVLKRKDAPKVDLGDLV